MTKAIIAVIGLAFLMLTGAFAVDAAYQESGREYVSQNETWIPDAGNWTTLNNSNLDDVIYDEQVTVYDSKDKLMIDGEDYEWNSSTGEVKAVVGGRLDGEPSATITYAYHAPSDTQRDMAALFGNGFKIAQVLVFVLTVAIVLLGVRLGLGGL